MSVFHNPALLGSSGSSGYKIERSLRFNSADSAYLSKTGLFGGTQPTIITFSCWIKRSKLGISQTIITSRITGDTNQGLAFDANDRLQIRGRLGSTNTDVSYYTNAVYRDTSAWYHIVYNATVNGTYTLWVNGQQALTAACGATISPIRSGGMNAIGRYGDASSDYFDGYLAEIHFIDGQALTPSSFGEINSTTGVWRPKRYSGTYGTNGFYLSFKNNSNVSALGQDQAYVDGIKAENNFWTVNNFNVTATSGSWSFGTQRENDFREGIIVSGITGFTSVSFNGTYGWGGDTGGSLSNYMALRDSSNTVIASTSVSGASGSWSLNATSLNAGTTYHLYISASSSGGSFMERNSYGSFTASYGGRGADNDSMIDTPTPYADGGNGRGNYATLNPLDDGGNILSNGNLDIQGTGNTYDAVRSTIAMSSGKWYSEFVINTEGLPSRIVAGLLAVTDSKNGYLGDTAKGYSIFESGSDVRKYNNSISSVLTSSASLDPGDVQMIAFNADTGKLWFGKNGTWFASGNPAAGTNEVFSGLTSGPYAFATSAYNTSDTGAFNFGQRPFAYTPPSGFLALNTQNLPEPTIKKPSSYMDVVTYTGTGATQTISSLGFSPDLIWTKSRSASANHNIVDAVRGVGNTLYSNTIDVEASLANQVTSFNSNGFTLGADTNGGTNFSGRTYVAWCWDESATPGFDIVTFTKTTTSQTFNHSLGVTPSMMIVKGRGPTTSNWLVYHVSANASPQNGGVALEQMSWFVSNTGYWNNTAPTSSQFTVGSFMPNESSVAYLWSEVAGFSKFGSYTGNGSTDGPFVYCGFRPRWVMIKRTDSAANWQIYDTVRDTYNQMRLELAPNSSEVENSLSLNISVQIDALSNGFKLRDSDTAGNASGGTYIFCAFAETPAKYSLAR